MVSLLIIVIALRPTILVAVVSAIVVALVVVVVNYFFRCYFICIYRSWNSNLKLAGILVGNRRAQTNLLVARKRLATPNPLIVGMRGGPS